MAHTAAANRAANAPTRFAPIVRTVKDKIPKIDIEDIVRSHKPTTDIVDQIRSATTPFYVNITPDICLDLLKLNDFNHNRDIDWSHIHDYYIQMTEGEWCNKNGDTIKTSTDLQLLDGQNRLIAAYMAKFTLEWMIIAPNCPPRSFAYMDIGKNRSGSDMVKINGFGTKKSQLAYAIKAILLYEKQGQIKSSIFRNRFIQDKKRTSRLVDDMGRAKSKWMVDAKDFFTAPQWATAYYILRTLPGMEDEARKFIDQFADGSNLKPTSPLRVARRHFENEFSYLKLEKKRNKMHSGWLTIKFNTLFTAWNHYVNRESVSEIKIDPLSPYIVKPNFR
jgi:hypothetical protein